MKKINFINKNIAQKNTKNYQINAIFFNFAKIYQYHTFSNIKKLE